MRTLSTILLITVLNSIAFTQNTLDVKNIPDSLTKNTEAVIRFSNTTYTRTSKNAYKEEYHYAVTILNKSAKGLADLYIPYDRNSSVSSIEGILYDKNGDKIKKLKKSDILDIAYHGGYSFYSDNRLKIYDITENDYPLTVEYSYTISHKALVGFSGWIPHEGFDNYVQESRLVFITTPDLDIQYKELNMPIKADVQIEDDEKTYTWQVENLKCIEYEAYAPPYAEIFPTVLLAPIEFSFEKSYGSLIDWKNLGQWIYELNTGRDEISEETKNYLISLTDTLETKTEKIAAVYKYMQGKTRYVSIQLGIGGLQPMMASEVDEKGYGDCKALSNYTKALLKCIGIESNYTIIGAGKQQQIRYTDFASVNQANHAILCVPTDNDTIWLECTSQKSPCNYLGGFTIDRYALWVTDEGGKLVRTPTFTAEENKRTSSIDINIRPEGSAGFELHTTYENILYDEISGLIYTSNKEQEEALLKGLNADGIKISSFNFSDESEDYAKAVLDVKGSLSQFATSAGKRMIFTPTYFLWNSFLSFISDDRKLPVYHSQGFTYTDSLNITIPDGYSVEYLPEDVNLETAYGDCTFEFQENESGLSVLRTIKINKGTYTKDLFDDIDDFLSSIDDCEEEKIVLTAQ